MLESIQIKNFTIIDSLKLNLNQRVTALTGETSMRKYILIDSIKLISDHHAGKDNVKNAQDSDELNVCFNIRYKGTK